LSIEYRTIPLFFWRGLTILFTLSTLKLTATAMRILKYLLFLSLPYSLVVFAHCDENNEDPIAYSTDGDNTDGDSTDNSLQDTIHTL
jgi:hypothetical protein